MVNEKERYYRADDVPVEVVRELRQAAERRELAQKEAFHTLLLPRVGLGPWEFQLRAAILLGQKRTAEGAFLGSQTEHVGVHLPVHTKQALVRAAESLGVQIGAAGRLVLVGLAGSIERALPMPKKQKRVRKEKKAS